jgi:hypothetical protein
MTTSKAKFFEKQIEESQKPQGKNPTDNFLLQFKNYQSKMNKTAE